MKKKPTDWKQDIFTEIDFMTAEERRKNELIRGVLEAKLKSMGLPKYRWQDIIGKALKDLT